MKKVLVTGGTGPLGQQILQHLKQQGAAGVALTRKTPQAGQVQGDLKTAAGLPAALQGMDVVIHCAHNPANPAEDVLYMQNLLREARAAGTKHVVLISILGVDRLKGVPYYRAKWQDEQLLQQSGLPYTLLRAAQFHGFVGTLLEGLARMPVLAVPRGVMLQPVQIETVAEKLALAALQEPAGRLPDLAGPQALPLDHLLQSWLQAQGKQRTVFSFPLPLPIFKTLRELTGGNIDRAGETWDQWLSRQSTVPNVQEARG